MIMPCNMMFGLTKVHVKSCCFQAKEDCLQNTLDMNSKQSESKTELEVTVVKLEEARQALEMEKKLIDVSVFFK